MPPSVTQLSPVPKLSFRALFYASEMTSSRDPGSRAARIEWVLDREKKNGRSPAALAAEVGCSRPTLLNWAHGKANMDEVGIGLILRFCEVTGVNWRWLMYGEEPRILRYAVTSRVAELSGKLAAMEAHSPDQLAMVARMIDAAAEGLVKQ